MFFRLKDKIDLEISKIKNINDNLNNFDYFSFINECLFSINEKLILRLVNKILLHNDKTIDIYFNFFKPDFIAF